MNRNVRQVHSIKGIRTNHFSRLNTRALKYDFTFDFDSVTKSAEIFVQFNLF